MKNLILFLCLSCLPAMADDIVVYPQAIATNNLVKSTNCPGDFRWRATYVKTSAQGWGWQTNGSGNYSAVIKNRPDVHIAFQGYNGDLGCGDTNVFVTRNPADVKYRFSAYGTNDPPHSTNDLPLELPGFLP